MRVLTVLFLVLMGLASPAHAWWDMGHMEVAAIAYGRLDDALRPKVDALIKQHPAYPLWIKGLEGLPDSDKAQAAFVHAATWADDIKGILSCKVSHAPGCYDYDKVTDGTAAQNIGTSDHIVHDYWHYYERSGGLPRVAGGDAEGGGGAHGAGRERGAVYKDRTEGRSLLEELRAFNPEMKAVFVSGYASDAEKIEQAGHPYLWKPFREHEFLAMVAEQLI